MRHIPLLMLLILFITCLATSGVQAVSAQPTIDVEYTFGSQVNIALQLLEGEMLQTAQVFLRSQGEAQTYSNYMTLNGNQAVYVHDLKVQPLRAFSTIEYWFTITPQDKETYTTGISTFFYDDNRFQWQIVEDETFRVHWYEGDASFGHSVISAAQEGVERARSLLPVGEIQPVEIYVYASGKELQSTLRMAGLSWVAGHADPDMNLMVVSLPAGPDQNRETKRQIPHELMHILLYQALGEGYANVPTWFKEGIASANELLPNADYYLILEKAVEDETLITLTQLCASFPKDSSVYLAYAEADSFVRYLHQNYGSRGLNELLNSYAGGESCELGSQATLGLTLDRLENNWRREALGDRALFSAIGNLLPWLLVLLLVILAPLSLMVVNLRRRIRLRERVGSDG